MWVQGMWLDSITDFVTCSHTAASLKMGFNLYPDKGCAPGHEQVEETMAIASRSK